MWAPADLFTRTVDAVALALKRAATLAWNNTTFLVIAAAVVVALLVVIGQVRRGPRG